MVQVESEAIDEIAYEPRQSVLLVRFAHGGWYTYFGVPAAVYEEFIAAESHGRYFHEHVRDRYPYHRGREFTRV
jgi:KTSC domain